MDLSKWLGLAFAVLLIGGASVLMIRSWRARQHRDGAIQLGSARFELGEPRFVGETLHVATTVADRPLERLAAKPFAYRARGNLLVGAHGFRWDGPGRSELFVDAERIEAVDTSSWAIDRAVESDGLVRVRYRSHNETPVSVDSYFRTNSPSESAQLLAALGALRKHSTTETTPGAS